MPTAATCFSTYSCQSRSSGRDTSCYASRGRPTAPGTVPRRRSGACSRRAGCRRNWHGIRRCLGHLGFPLGRHIAPDLSVIGLDFSNDRTVGIDLVAGVNEEIGRVAPHRLVDAVTAPFRIDPPSLPGLVAGISEGDRAAGRAGDAQPASGRRAQRLWISQILKCDPIKEVSPRWQIAEIEARRLVGRGKSGSSGDPARVAKILPRCVLDNHPGRTVGLAPDDRPPPAGIAAHHATGNLRPLAVPCDDSRTYGRLRHGSGDRQEAAPSRADQAPAECRRAAQHRTAGRLKPLPFLWHRRPLYSRHPAR